MRGCLLQVFEEMKRHSLKDPQCKPNVITYSALMTACCAGGRPDKAHEAFLDMKARGIQADHISYSTLIAGECGTTSSHHASRSLAFGCH